MSTSKQKPASMEVATESPPSVQSITHALAEPFDASEVKFKPSVVTGNRALAIFYVDARVVQDRLDHVLGVVGWQDDYEVLADGSVVCRLRILLDGEWITKVDVGGQSDQKDEGDRMKSAFSDALKRTAVKFGIGRYLYRLPAQWCDYDPSKRQFVRPPSLPNFAKPTSKPAPISDKLSKQGVLKRGELMDAIRFGQELFDRLAAYDDKLSKQGVLKRGELMDAIRFWGARNGHGDDISKFPAETLADLVKEVKRFEAQARTTSAAK